MSKKKREAVRNEILKRTWAELRKEGGDPDKLFALAMELKKLNLFGPARRVLARARQVGPDNSKLTQQHALCTYKDKDVPAHRALDDALHILGELGDLATSKDPETLGLAGAIFKRKWQTDGDKQHLERSLAYYLRGYQHGKSPSERGYTGINAAFLLDLLAHVEDKQAWDTSREPSSTAAARRVEAKRIREELVELLTPADEEAWGAEDTKLNWWDCATLAEAHFGLGPSDVEEGKDIDKTHYGKAQGWIYKGVLTHQAREGEDDRAGLSQWEFQSTARQLAELAKLQVGKPGEPLSREEKLSKPAWQVISQLAGDGAETLALEDAAFKLGIGLSGGGFRASLFHIGVLARLAELDLLRRVEVLSCVSGGSILGAYYYLKVRQLLESKDDSQIVREDYIRLVEEMARDFLASVQRNLRTRVAASFLGNLKIAFGGNYSRSDRLAELYEKHIYALLGPDQALTMDKLEIEPKGAEPDETNWRRRNKVPSLVLNATSLNTGHNWQFTTSFMGESAFAVDEEIDGNWLLRRMKYRDAPGEHQAIPLGQAVGASACVPGLFEPIALSNLYPKDPKDPKAVKDDKGLPAMVVRLVDGGVHDNQGVVSLIEQDCSVIVVSDASGQMTSDEEPGGGFLGPILRTNSVLMERVRQSQFQDLKARMRAGLLKGLMIVHMKKDFDVERVDWRGCDEPPEKDEAQQGDHLPYGVRKDMQAALAAVRTDLDSFSDIEGHALMTSGYLMTRKYGSELSALLNPGAAEPKPVAWKFLELEEPLEYDSSKGASGGESESARRFEKVRKHLKVAAKGAFRVFSLMPALKIGALLVLLAVILARLPWGNWEDWGAVVLPAVLVVLAILAAKKGRRVLRSVLLIALSIFGFLLAQIHLLIFDRLFLKLGRLDGAKSPPKKE